MIDAFGVYAIFGRPLGAGEIERMLFAVRFVNAWQARDKSGDPILWEDKYPDLAEVLARAEEVADASS